MLAPSRRRDIATRHATVRAVSRRLKALFLLALSLVRTLLRVMVGRGRRGYDAFVQNYAEDGLSAVDAEQREQIPTFGRCIACGLCDRGEGERIALSDGRYSGLMAIVLAGSRSMPDYGAAAISLGFVPEEVLADKESICPTGVPFRQIARFVRDKAAEARVSLPAARGEKRTVAVE